MIFNIFKLNRKKKKCVENDFKLNNLSSEFKQTEKDSKRLERLERIEKSMKDIFNSEGECIYYEHIGLGKKHIEIFSIESNKQE